MNIKLFSKSALKVTSILLVTVIIFSLSACKSSGNKNSVVSSNVNNDTVSEKVESQEQSSSQNSESDSEYVVYDILGVSKNVVGESWENMKKMREEAKEFATLSKDTVFINDQPQNNTVYLTFDDGPDNKITPKIIDILAENKVNGNFFFIGEYVKKHPDVVKKAFDNGNYIGSHCNNHKNLTKLSPDEVKAQVKDSQDAIKEITGQNTTFVRPPYGAINEEVISTLKSIDCKIALWSIDTLDWSQKEVSNIVKNVTDNLKAGDIILMHSDSNKIATAEALPQLIKAIIDKGYKIGTLDNF